jgi:glutathione S-transferase
MTQSLQVIGSYLSPYVRKVLAVLHLKGLTYEIDPIVPFYGNDAFSRLSPLRRIPVLIDRDRDLVVNDSTVICEYLEECYPDVSLYPADPERRARARWLEEYADSRLGDVFIWQLFNQNIRKFVWQLPPDDDVIRNATDHLVPEILDHLEGIAPADGFMLGELTIADIALAAFFRNLEFCRYELDASRWPNVDAHVRRTLALDAFERLVPYEQQSLRVPVTEVRGALQALGAPLTDTTHGTNAPRKGPMTQR